MKRLALAIGILLSVSISQASIICTVTTYTNPQGAWTPHIAGFAIVELEKEQGNFLVRRDGSFETGVSYSDAMYSNPSQKLGDVDGSAFINVSRNQGEKQGISILIATLTNQQTTAHLQSSSASQNDEVFIFDHNLGLSVGCTTSK